MITFNNWVISNSGLIAYQFDNLSAYLEITGDIPTGWTWNLYLQSGANLNIVSLTETENGIGIELTAEMLALSGYYYIQLQGTQGDVVKHTNIIQVYIPRSLSGNVQWPTVPSEFTQVEQRIQTLNSAWTCGSGRHRYSGHHSNRRSRNRSQCTKHRNRKCGHFEFYHSGRPRRTSWCNSKHLRNSIRSASRI